jgi:hypothetical protein
MPAIAICEPLKRRKGQTNPIGNVGTGSALPQQPDSFDGERDFRVGPTAVIPVHITCGSTLGAHNATAKGGELLFLNPLLWLCRKPGKVEQRTSWLVQELP